MYSNPTYNPAPLTSTDSTVVAQAAWKRYTTHDAHGFPPLGLVATQQTFPPGSTFKVDHHRGRRGEPARPVEKYVPGEAYTTLPHSNKLLYNSGGGACGGTVAVMLPESCDPGYALLGLDIGAEPHGVGGQLVRLQPDRRRSTCPASRTSYFPPAASFSDNLPGLAYSSIGQENVRATALQNALVAAAIANGGSR